MYIIERKMTVEKAHAQSLVERFGQTSIINRVDGFIKKEVLLDDSKKEVVIKILIYWKDQQSFAKWHASDEHKALHQAKPDEKPEGIIGMEVSRYQLISESLYEKGN